MAASNSTETRDTSRTASRRNRRIAIGAQELSLALVSESSEDRRAVEQSIMQKFERAYGAHLTHFLPDLLKLGTADELGAVAGIRAARKEALFLEQYLDRPVEQAVARAFKTPVDRDSIVEIGNLAANVPGYAYTLFAALATILARAGFRWVVCTATPQVASMLSRMGLSARAICRADPSLLEADAADWGDYYASGPRVMAGDVQLAARQVVMNSEIARQIDELYWPITQMAATLGKASR